MAKLTDEQKALIVQRLACFVAPSEILAELRAEGVEASASQITYFDPDSSGTHVAGKWADLFRETRARYITDASSLASTSQVYRIRRLEEMERISRRKGNLVLAAAMLRQIAEEIGGLYTNRRIVGSGDSLQDTADELGMTREQVAKALAAAPPAPHRNLRIA